MAKSGEKENLGNAPSTSTVINRFSNPFVSILPVSCYFTFMIRTDIQFNYYRKNLVPNSSQRNKSLKVTKFLGNTTCNNLNTLEIRIKRIFLYIKFTIYPIQPLQGNKSFSDKNTQMVNFFRSRIWFIGFISHCDLNYFYSSAKIHFPIYVCLTTWLYFLPCFSILKSSCFHFGQYLVSKACNYYKSIATSIIPLKCF